MYVVLLEILIFFLFIKLLIDIGNIYYRNKLFNKIDKKVDIIDKKINDNYKDYAKYKLYIKKENKWISLHYNPPEPEMTAFMWSSLFFALNLTIYCNNIKR